MAWINKSAKLERESLCRSCRYAHIQRGYEKDEEQIFCTYTDHDHAVLFAVRFCADYCDRDAPAAEQLEKAYHC
jgi:hypothetical protein